MPTSISGPEGETFLTGAPGTQIEVQVEIENVTEDDIAVEALKNQPKQR